VTAPDRPKPKGFRRLERWLMGIIMGMILIGVLWLILDHLIFKQLERVTVARWGVIQR